MSRRLRPLAARSRVDAPGADLTMGEPFKNLLDARLVREAAAALARGNPWFDRRRFVRLATAGLEDLELKGRAMHIADALEATLPADFERACAAIEAALGPPLPTDGEQNAEAIAPTEGLSGWIVWPLGEFVARRGLDRPERALLALHALTQRLTAEFAIRPLLVRHRALVLQTLQRWTCDPSPHVRRLCSEGSRPRLPWGLRLKGLIADPAPTLPILEALQDDPSAYVRRSVANHLNDIAKDHPQRVVAWVQRWLPDAPPQRVALLKHASRTLIKQGNAAMLTLWGAGTPFEGRCRLRLASRRVVVGGSLGFELTLRSTAHREQRLVIDYAVHHVKADGQARPKVFKGWTLTLGAGEAHSLARRHSMREVTTRRYHAGRHALDLRINGSVVAEATFQLDLR
jgi:3-methyladenine DNA glycosylase AlkC